MVALKRQSRRERSTQGHTQMRTQDYVTSPDQRPGNAWAGNPFTLSPEQLGAVTDEALDRFEDDEPELDDLLDVLDL